MKQSIIILIIIVIIFAIYKRRWLFPRRPTKILGAKIDLTPTIENYKERGQLPNIK